MTVITGELEPKDRARAYRLRAAGRKGVEISPEDAEWLKGYEAQQAENKGASSSRRMVSLDIEEEAQSVGTGTAAEAAAMGALAREEGRRIDYLSVTSMQALERACNLYERMAESLLKRTKALEEVHLSMLDAVREHYLARAQAEGELVAAGQPPEKSEVDKLIETLLPALLPQVMAAMGGKKGLGGGIKRGKK